MFILKCDNPDSELGYGLAYSCPCMHSSNIIGTAHIYVYLCCLDPNINVLN